MRMTTIMRTEADIKSVISDQKLVNGITDYHLLFIDYYFEKQNGEPHFWPDRDHDSADHH